MVADTGVFLLCFPEALSHIQAFEQRNESFSSTNTGTETLVKSVKWDLNPLIKSACLTGIMTLLRNN